MADEPNAAAPAAGAPPAAEGGATPPAPESLLGGAPPAADAGQGGANAGTEPNKEGADPASQTGKDGAQPEGAPEKYEFTAPEGVTFDQALLGKFEPLAREMNLNQANAQKLVDLYAEAQAGNTQALAENWAKQGQTWLSEVKADPEIGGEKLPQTIRNIEAVQKTFGTPKLTESLKAMGLDNHPELVRFFNKVGSQMVEGSFVHGGHDAKGSKSYAQAFYPDMNP